MPRFGYLTLLAVTIASLGTSSCSARTLGAIIEEENKQSHKGLHASWDTYENKSLHRSITLSVLKITALFSGMSEAIYDDPSAIEKEECFNEESIASIYNLIEGFSHGDGFWDTLFKVLTGSYVFSVNL